MDKFKLTHKNIAHMFFGIIVVLVVGCLISVLSKDIHDDEHIELNNGWDVTINENTIEDVALDSFTFNDLKENDVVIIRCILPDNDILHPAIKLSADHCKLNVSLDGDVIYSYGDALVQSNRSIGGGDFIITLPNSSKGKELEIRYDVIEDSNISSLCGVELIDEDSYIKYIFNSQIVDICIGAFMIVLGFFAVICGVMKSLSSAYSRKLLCLGLITMCMGNWIYARFGILSLFIRKIEIVTWIKTTIEYTMLYVMETLIIVLLCHLLQNKTRKKIILCVAIISAIVTCISLIINLMNVCSMESILIIHEVIGTIGIITGVIFVFMEYNELNALDKMITKSIIILVIMLIIDLVLLIINGSIHFTSILSIGAIAYVLYLIVGYLQNSKDYIDKAVEKSILTKMAYVDMLTKLNNRGVIMGKLEEMDNNEVKDYVIFNFDLNGLKKINDENGHFEGDRYIMEFTDVIKDILGDIATIGRVGGDEFVAIIENVCPKEQAEQIINKMNNMVETKNNRNIFSWKMSFAYGYAISNTDESLNVWEAYDKADEEMYKCKKEQKSKK